MRQMGGQRMTAYGAQWKPKLRVSGFRVMLLSCHSPQLLDEAVAGQRGRTPPELSGKRAGAYKDSGNT